MNPTTPPARPPSKWRTRLGWIAPVVLAIFVVCSGCFMLFAFAITARGELNAPILGSDWRVWQLQQKGTNGLGASQTHIFTSESGQVCHATRVWLITWRPQAQIEVSAYDECETTSLRPEQEAWASRRLRLPVIQL